MMAISLIFVFQSLGFLCEPAMLEAEALLKSNQSLLTYNLSTDIEFNRCSARQRSRARYFRLLSLHELGENRDALRLVEGVWPSESDHKKALLFARVFLLDEPTPLSQVWKLRKNLWSNRYEFLTAESHLLNLPDKDGEIRNLLRDLNHARRYWPSLVAGLSLIPGLGQSVMGDWSSAGLSLLLNGLFGYATYEFYRKDLYAPSVISGTIFSITYVGGIVQAGRLAVAKNKFDSQAEEKALRQSLFREILD